MHDRAHFADLLVLARSTSASLLFLLIPVCLPGQPKYNETVLHTFAGGSDGAQPQAGLIADSRGNLYGTTYAGGDTTACAPAGCGVVFELSPPTKAGQPWAETVLYAFKGGADGLWPSAGLVFDARGNLYGTTYAGGERQICLYPEGPLGCGVVFELSPPATGKGKWTYHVLYTFLGNNSSTGTDILDGAGPLSTLVFDTRGNLYGTTYSGGAINACAGPGVHGCGTIFELSPPATADGAWTETVLYIEGSSWLPAAGVVLDGEGNLYGTSSFGAGAGCDYMPYIYGCGSVFELSPPANGKGPWIETVLHRFTSGSDGATPLAGVILDARGNLYGTAKAGGGPYDCCGVVFRLSPPASGKGPWTETVLHTFTGEADGGVPEAPLIFDAKGHLYGTTSLYGYPAIIGNYEDGVVFELSPPATANGEWDDDVLYTFCSSVNCADGGVPAAGLIYDAAGNLYGTTQERGDLSACDREGCGVVFRLSLAQEPAATATMLRVTPSSAAAGSPSPVKLTATVFDESGPGTPSGSVSFLNGSKELGTHALNGGLATLQYDPATLGVGSYAMTARYGGDSLFDASDSPSARLSILKAQAITWPKIIGTYYAASKLPLKAHASSGLAVTFASETPKVCTVSKATASLLIAGNCTIRAAQAGNAIYASAQPVSQSIVVQKK